MPPSVRRRCFRVLAYAETCQTRSLGTFPAARKMNTAADLGEVDGSIARGRADRVHGGMAGPRARRTRDRQRSCARISANRLRRSLGPGLHESRFRSLRA